MNDRNERFFDLIKQADANGLVVRDISFCSPPANVSDALRVAPTPAPLVNHAPAPKSTLGEYIVPFGKKYKGQKLHEIDPFQLDNYNKFLMGSAEKDGKPLKGVVLEFSQTAEAYLKSIERPRR